MKETKREKINEKSIQYIWFADIIALVADWEENMKKMLLSLKNSLKKFTLQINLKKTKIFMVAK